MGTERRSEASSPAAAGHPDDRLAEIMGRLAAGDHAAVFSLLDEYGRAIRAAVVHIARDRVGRPCPDDLDGLTADACFVLARVARGWRPEGALPWTWARHRLVNLVDQWAGPPTRPWRDQDDLRPLEAWPGPEPDPLRLLQALAGDDPRCRLLLDALAVAVPGADHDVFLRYAVQASSGDPAPSHTVAADLGLKPPTVRQRASRARRRLCDVVKREPRFAELADLALLGPPGGSPSRAASAGKAA